jgi:hypothetical protein
VWVIYHSRDPFPARQAAAMHVGALSETPPATDAGLEVARARLGGDSALTQPGLWLADTDALGRQVFALGCASRPDVVWRAFHGLADLFAIPHDRFVLQHVGRAVAWADLKVKALRRLGLDALARRVERLDLLRSWACARQAVAEVRARLNGP